MRSLKGFSPNLFGKKKKRVGGPIWEQITSCHLYFVVKLLYSYHYLLVILHIIPWLMKLPNSPSTQYRRHHPPPNYHKSRPKGHKIRLGLIASLDGRRGKRSRAELFRILEFGSKYIHLSVLWTQPDNWYTNKKIEQKNLTNHMMTSEMFKVFDRLPTSK